MKKTLNGWCGRLIEISGFWKFGKARCEGMKFDGFIRNEDELVILMCSNCEKYKNEREKVIKENA